MKLSPSPWKRASWPFGRNAMLVWDKKTGRHLLPSPSKGVKPVSLPTDDAAPRHEPVMVQEILADFALEPGQTVFDGTLGLGGHSLIFAERIAPGGTLVGTEWDEAMLAVARARMEAAAPKIDVRLVQCDFRDLPAIARESKLAPNAILLDLGLNSAQVDDMTRGFSFREDGPLDMRMARTSGEPAAAILNRMTPGQLEAMLHDLGDERWARAIAKQIFERRKSRPLKTTSDLVECVLAAIPPGAREKRIHPATRTFQAVRIFTNRELDGLDVALQGLADCLAPGGTLSVLSYHSGEDRIVKHAFRELDGNGFSELHRKPIEPTEAEIRQNPRSRSAKLRSLRRNSSP